MSRHLKPRASYALKGLVGFLLALFPLLFLAALAGAEPEPVSTRPPSSIRANKDFLEQAMKTTDSALKKGGDGLAVDFVLVLDTTLSMAPHLEHIVEYFRAGRERISAFEADNNVSGRLKFGLWGYRDPVEDIPGIEYLTHNYTPELLGVDDFQAVLADLRATEVDSQDYPEDLFSGVSDAIYKTNWRKDSLKIMVLIGDAPGHEMGHKWNFSGKDAETLRVELGENRITFTAVQIRPKGAKRFQAMAEDQFQTLAANRGAGKSAYIDIKAGDSVALNAALNAVMSCALELLNEALKKAYSADE